MRRSLSNHDKSAIFHLDSLFLCLDGESADEFSAITAAMPRDLAAAEAAIQSGQAARAVAFLITHCHEFIHYHQFVGTQLGLVYRRLAGARARVREFLLQDIGAECYQALMAEGSGRAALLAVAGANRLSLHPGIRDRADPAMLQLLGWFELFDSYLFAGDYAELFASAARVKAILDACAAITRLGGSFDLQEIVTVLHQAPAAAFDPASRPGALFPVCEAQATLNEYALHYSGDDAMAAKRQKWFEGRYWEIPKRFGWSPSVKPEELARISAAALLATDIALDAVTSPSLHGATAGRLVLHPTRMIDALVAHYDRWRDALDGPLERWPREDFLTRRAHAAAVAMKGARLDVFDVPTGDSQQGEARQAHVAIQYLGLFAGFQQKIAQVRSSDPAAALFPVAAILERPESFTQESDHLHKLICPFLAVGGVPFQNHLDEESWMRWRLLSGYEIWLDNMFSGRGADYTHLPGDARFIERIGMIAKQRIESAHAGQAQLSPP